MVCRWRVAFGVLGLLIRDAVETEDLPHSAGGEAERRAPADGQQRREAAVTSQH